VWLGKIQKLEFCQDAVKTAKIMNSGIINHPITSKMQKIAKLEHS
jgi:hypothetical protein